MKRQINVIAKLFIAVAISANLSACKKEEVKATEEPILKIGVVSPLSSNIATIVEEIKEAVLLTNKKYENAPLKVEVIFEDSAMQPMRAISAAKKLIHVDKVNALISQISSVSQVVTPLATEANVVHIANVNNANIENHPTSFTFWPSPEEQAERYLAYLKENDIKNIAFLVLNSVTTETLYSALEKQLRNTNIQYKKFSLAPGQRDYSIDLEKIELDDNYDMIGLVLYSPETDIVGKQIKNANIKTPISALDTVSVASNKNLYEGIEYVCVYPGDKEILNKIQDDIKSTGVFGFAITIDSVDMLHKVAQDFYLKHKRIPNGQEISDLLIKMKEYKGLSGAVKINNNRKITPPAVLMQIQNGEEVVIEEK